MGKNIFRNDYSYFIILLYILDLIWWWRINLNGLTNTTEAYYFNASYGFIALAGAAYGIHVAYRSWGGWKSILGKGLIMLSLGLISQAAGVFIWFYYNVIANVDVPYPSLADIGFFGLIPAYTYGAILFAQASGAKFYLKNKYGQILAIIIPLVTLYISYALFLKDIGFDFSQPVKLFLDIGYPLGEIVPVSIALFILTLTKGLLGGKVRKKVLFLVFAFLFQFITEYAFLYTAGVETYVNGGINDLLYATSYTIMSLSLLSFADLN